MGEVGPACINLQEIEMKIAANSKPVMIGDSITDCDRARPIGEGGMMRWARVASLVDALLKTACTEPAEVAVPTTNIRIINMGISGNTVRDLQARWQTDVLDLQPDWLSIMIGINDVWRQFDSPLQRERQVSLAGLRPYAQQTCSPLRAPTYRARFDDALLH